jgi:hypothetical protein
MLINYVNGGLKVSNSGGIKLSTCQSLRLKTRGHVDDRCRGVPHVARFVQQRFEHQRDRQTDRTQPGNGAKVSEFTGTTIDAEDIQDRGFTGKDTIAKDFVHEVRPKIGVPAIYPLVIG